MVEWGEEQDRLNADEYAQLRELHFEDIWGYCSECQTRWPCRTYRVLVREPEPIEPPLIDQMVRTYYARRSDNRTVEESMDAVLAVVRAVVKKVDNGTGEPIIKDVLEMLGGDK